MSPVKDAVMALFEPSTDVLEPALPVAPDAVIEIVICPHCDCPDCEVWSTTEARMATCPECRAEFRPLTVESAARNAVTAIFEQRGALRRRVIESKEDDVVKSELFRLLQ